MRIKNRTRYYIYILRCRDSSFYTGSTNDLAKRVAQHSAGKGAKYTRSRLSVTLVYRETFISKLKALKREREIKKLSHSEKINLISKQPIYLP